VAHRRRRTLRARDLPWEGYALAAFGPTLVTLIIPADGSSLLVPALCYLLTVVAAAAVGRIGPGLLAAALSTAGLLFRFVPPINRLSVDTTGELFAVGVFAVTALVVSGVLDRLEAARESSERAVERLTRLQAVTAALSQAVDVEHVTAVVVEQACRELDGQRGTLSVLNEGTRELTLVGAYGLEPDVQAKWHSYPLDGNLPASDAARSRQLVLLQSLHERNQRYPAIAATPPFHDHALACVPLLFEDRVFGVISLSFGGPRPFPEEDCRFLEALGAQCAQALERARLYEAEREAARRQAFLSEASRLLNSSLDYEATLARITRLAVPALADSASVHLFQGEELRLVALAAADPEREHTMRRLSSREDDRANDPTMRQVALSGESILTPEIPHETWAAIAEDDDHRALLEALGTRSALLVSLGGQERRLGLLTLGMNGSSRVFTDDDRSLVEDLAARAGVAIENALSHRARAEQARVLQQSLLPPGLPSIPGLDVAVHYRAAGDGSIVGGDFFDLFRMGERWGVVLGDVSGKGVEAASLTALTRYTVRAVAMTEDRPSAVLSMCNRAVLEADAGEAFCTMVFAVIEQEGDGARVRVAVGGHPLPLCRRATGEIEHVGTTGTAVGLFPDAEFADGEVVLGPQDTLVLFTDGLIEARTPAGDFAPQLLEQTLRASHGAGAAETVAAITTAVGALEEGWARDDMAVVVLTVPEPAPAMRSIRLPGVPALAVVRGDEFVDELVRELELVRLGGRQGVLRTDYPQRLLAVIEDVVSRFARARGSVRDQAEAALAAGEDVFTAEFELPAGAGVALQQTAALLAEVESFARDGLLLTMPRPDDVRAMQDRLLDAIVAQLEGGPASAPWDDGAGGLGALGPSRRTDAGSLPIQAAPDGGERAANLRLAADLSAAGQARRFLSEVLTRWGVSEDVGEEAALPLSELVTNAVLHTGSDVRMVVRLDASALRIEVHDASAVLPNRRSHDVEAGTGRGLELVEALCERWGVQPTPEGKAVWFEVRV
jgi:GAF domain-containing protein/anti-sigma regulatory factor (Ser/Thr protein kinase)